MIRAKSDEKPTVYYDGSCPMCSREIGFYQRQTGAGGVEWVDVSACKTSEVAPGLTKERALARLHVRRGDGTLVSGAEGFATLWQSLPGFQIAGRIAMLPGVRHGLEAAYVGFLPIRPWLQRRFKARNLNA